MPVDTEKLWRLLVDHYWDSLQKDRDLILSHCEGVLRIYADGEAVKIAAVPTEELYKKAFPGGIDASGSQTGTGSAYYTGREPR